MIVDPQADLTMPASEVERCFPAHRFPHPMTDDFVGVITRALAALDPHRDRLRIETDDILDADHRHARRRSVRQRDLFAAAASSGEHCVPRPSRAVAPGSLMTDLPDARTDRLTALPWTSGRHGASGGQVTQSLSARKRQRSFRFIRAGIDGHMDEICGCIDFPKNSGRLREIEELRHEAARRYSVPYSSMRTRRRKSARRRAM